MSALMRLDRAERTHTARSERGDIMTSESVGEAGESGESGNLDGLTPEERLKALGLELPSVPSAVGTTSPGSR